MNIGENLRYFKKKWGKEYNKHNLTAIRSIVFCNGWYLNKAANLDYKAMGMCPMHITLIEKNNKTTALFVLPSLAYQNSAAINVISTIEREVLELINNGMK